MSVREETEGAVAAAEHLTAADQGAVAVLLHLATQIDNQTDGGLTPDGKLDNVSVPTFLKYCDALGLTPVARLRFEPSKKEPAGGKLAQLQSIQSKRKRSA